MTTTQGRPFSISKQCPGGWQAQRAVVGGISRRRKKCAGPRQRNGAFESIFRTECPKFAIILRIFLSEKNLQISDTMSDLKTQLTQLIDRGGRGRVWVPADFVRIATRGAVDKALQRLVAAGELRRIDRGLYDKPIQNKLTRCPNPPDYRAVVEAIARRDQLRLLVDGMTAANDLGLTDAVPAHVTIHTDARRRSIKLDNLKIEFKQTAPSRLYWAGRPAMRIVQALYWLKDPITSDHARIMEKLTRIVSDPAQGPAIREDLLEGFSVLPIWMQSIVRELLKIETQAVMSTRHSPRALRRPLGQPRNLEL